MAEETEDLNALLAASLSGASEEGAGFDAFPPFRSRKQADGSYQTMHGTYLVTCEGMSQGKLGEKHGTRKGQRFITANLRIDQVLADPQGKANKEGETCKEWWSLDRDMDKKLAGIGKVDMGRLRAYCEASFKPFLAELVELGALQTAKLSDGQVEEYLQKMIAHTILNDGAFNLRGTQTICTVYNSKPSGKGIIYSETAWKPVPTAAPDAS